MQFRAYSVRAGMTGRMVVEVPLGAIKLRGERNAVLAYAWAKLMGEDILTGRVDTHSRTRKFLRIETLSRYEAHRPEVFETFCSKVRYSPMHNTVR